MLFDTAADEMREWAERCRRWASAARTGDQRATLHSLERLLHQAATEAEQNETSQRMPLQS